MGWYDMIEVVKGWSFRKMSWDMGWADMIWYDWLIGGLGCKF